MRHLLPLALIALFLPAISLACSCLKPRNVTDSLNLVDYVFRGLVVRKLKDVNSQSVFIVRVNRVYKGCDFKTSERIIVETGVNSAMCGVTLKLNTTLVFSGFGTEIASGVQTQIRVRDKIKRAVSIGLCDYNVESSKLPTVDTRTLRRYDNRSCQSKCVTGRADCSTNQYCDNRTCNTYPDKQCSNVVTCNAAPCSTLTCAVNPVQCYDNYCGGCNAIFVDATGTRVCS